METVAEAGLRPPIRTGIYSGSFNPIHIGHLALANWLTEFGGLDEVWFLVSPHNPLKERASLMEDGLRLELARKAVGTFPKFTVSDFEFTLPTPSYTIHTLRALQTAHPLRQFHLIMGADSWESISLWREYEALMREFPILIYPRSGFQVTIPAQYPHIRLVEAPTFEVSSSFIRESLLAGKDVRFFLPEAIRSYFTP